jgi:hypothetical protein
MTPTTPRRWFQYGLRTMFVVVTVFGVALGWIGMQFKWKHERERALHWLLPIRERQIAHLSGRTIPQANGLALSNAGVPVSWRLKVLGVRGVERIEVFEDSVGTRGGYSLDELRILFPEARVVSVDARRRP